MLKYPEYAQELTKLLHDDQLAWKAFWRDNHDKQDEPDFQTRFKEVRAGQQLRSKRVLEILHDIHEPSVSNIGEDAAQAISVIALHDSLEVLREVLVTFTACYERDKNDTYYQAIPSMVDRVRILERKPQVLECSGSLVKMASRFYQLLRILILSINEGLNTVLNRSDGQNHWLSQNQSSLG